MPMQVEKPQAAALRVAVLGAGALAGIVVDALPRALPGACRIVAVAARTPAHAQALAERCGAAWTTSAQGLLAHRPDVIVELAGREALAANAEAILSSGVSLIAASAGALADRALLERIKSAAQSSGAKLYVPNGAVGGLDLLQTYAAMTGARLEIESVKAPKSLEGAPGLRGRSLPDEEAVVFEGGVKAAIEAFPKNVNVAVAAALAAEAEDARVRVVSRPGAAESLHRIRIANALMHAELSIASKPDPANPRSSTSTAWSIVALLKQLTSPVVFF